MFDESNSLAVRYLKVGGMLPRKPGGFDPGEVEKPQAEARAMVTAPP
jgi:hypothetical protein